MEAIRLKRISKALTIALAATFGLVAVSSANAGIVVSFNDDGGTPHDLLYNGITVSSGSAVGLSPAELVLEENDLYGSGAIEDIDALHLMQDGTIVLSTTTVGYIDGTPYQGGDLVLWDPVSGTASLFMSHTLFTGIENIDAVFVYEFGPNAGKYLLSTALTAELGGTSFSGGDVVLYDPIADTATILVDDVNMTGTAGQRELDGIHAMKSGKLILSFGATGGGLGGLSLEQHDLVLFDPDTTTATVFVDGEDLFDGAFTADLNAVSATPAAVPLTDHWGAWLLVAGLSLAGFLALGWRNSAQRTQA